MTINPSASTVNSIKETTKHVQSAATVSTSTFIVTTLKISKPTMSRKTISQGTLYQSTGTISIDKGLLKKLSSKSVLIYNVFMSERCSLYVFYKAPKIVLIKES